MAAPTPVSALLHAATIMVSGIFFILRLTTVTKDKGFDEEIPATFYRLTINQSTVIIFYRDP